MRKPYLAHLGRFPRQAGSVVAHLVDGEWIRNHVDIDFTNGAHHLVRSYIPSDEVWVDREAPNAGELDFLVRHQVRQRELMLAGTPYLRALSSCNRIERRERRAAWRRPLPTGAAARERVRKERMGTIGDDELWLVDGRAVRDLFDPNFTEGGHQLRHRFIPRREIWIDDALVVSERHYVIAHEAHEVDLMRGGMSYDHAHDRALQLERRLRRSGSGKRRTG
jgi:hypothetical protein